MSDEQKSTAADSLLLPFLDETDTATAEARLGDLISRHADPVIRNVIRRKLAVSLHAHDGGARNQDALDLAGEVTARLVAELRNLKSERSGRDIADFKAYAAVTTYNGCHDYLRRLHPRRWQLRNKLRYLLTHRPQLALWRSADGDWLCGLAQWSGLDAAVESSAEPPGHAIAAFLGAAPDEASLRSAPADRQIESLLRWQGAAIRLDRLVDLAADLWQVEEADVAVDPRGGPGAIADPGRDATTMLVMKRYLERLWEEIRELPPRQRAALLLGLRDTQGAGVVSLLPLVGVASIRQIASTLETPAEQFAEQWRTLPWNDTRIGHHLGVERQQVVNLRKAARARLARRMRGW